MTPRRIVTAVVIVTLLYGCRATGKDAREDMTAQVISCEEAFANIERCCPTFLPDAHACEDVEYVSAGPGCRSAWEVRTTSESIPQLSTSESGAIRDLSCADLVEQGFCDLAD